MKHAICAFAPFKLLAVTTLEPQQAVKCYLSGKTEMPPILAVLEVSDDTHMESTIPPDAPVVWFYRSSRAKEAGHVALV